MPINAMYQVAIRSAVLDLWAGNTGRDANGITDEDRFTNAMHFAASSLFFPCDVQASAGATFGQLMDAVIKAPKIALITENDFFAELACADPNVHFVISKRTFGDVRLYVKNPRLARLLEQYLQKITVHDEADVARVFELHASPEQVINLLAEMVGTVNFRNFPG